MDASNIHDVFCRCYAATSAATQLDYHVSDLLTSTSKHANDSLYNTPI